MLADGPVTRSLITDAARKAVMEEAGRTASSITGSDREGPTLLLDAVDPDGVRFIQRYCRWLARGLAADSLIAARFDRSFQRLRRLGAPMIVTGKEPLPLHSLDMPAHWDGPAPDIMVIRAVLWARSRDPRITDEEKHVLQVCINECDARMDNPSSRREWGDSNDARGSTDEQCTTHE